MTKEFSSGSRAEEGTWVERHITNLFLHWGTANSKLMKITSPRTDRRCDIVLKITTSMEALVSDNESC